MKKSVLISTFAFAVVMLSIIIVTSCNKENNANQNVNGISTTDLSKEEQITITLKITTKAKWRFRPLAGSGDGCPGGGGLCARIVAVETEEPDGEITRVPTTGTGTGVFNIDILPSAIGYSDMGFTVDVEASDDPMDSDFAALLSFETNETVLLTPGIYSVTDHGTHKSVSIPYTVTTE